ncbi:ATP-binding protein [Paenibacillus validus]|uniref:ATP-binding protein n=1 Tax=Paenibacillus validus TaxID=44253 RepID=UPI003D272466
MSTTAEKELQLYKNAFFYDFVGKSIVDVQGAWIKVRKKNYYLSIMEEELRRIEQIVGELLLLAKPPNVQLRKYNLVDTIEQIVALLQTRAIMNNIEIEFQRRAADTEIYCDENQIKQVFINLIQNALEVTPVDGRVAIDIDSDADGVAIAIRDEGPGIPEDKLRKLGEPFFTTKENGTGLGLTVSYNIIENHGGRIQVNSIVGQGTTFTIRLPFEPKTLAAEPLLTG